MIFTEHSLSIVKGTIQMSLHLIIFVKNISCILRMERMLMMKEKILSFVSICSLLEFILVLLISKEMIRDICMMWLMIAMKSMLQ